MKFTDAMLDSVEAVKGVRDPAYWDGRCQQHFDAKQKGVDIKDPTPKNKTASSS
jgi:hypothetical protein